MVANKRLGRSNVAKKDGTATASSPTQRVLSARRVRWLVGIVSGILVGANAGVQLWQNLDLGDHFLAVTQKPPVIQVQ